MNKESAAKLFEGREYPFELSKQEKKDLKDAGLVVVYGASDDLIEFDGAIYDEAGVSDGGDVWVLGRPVPKMLEEHECECKYCGFEDLKKMARKISALWCKENDYSWTYKTEIPHATFEIMEDGEHYCRGFVFSVGSL